MQRECCSRLGLGRAFLQHLGEECNRGTCMCGCVDVLLFFSPLCFIRFPQILAYSSLHVFFLFLFSLPFSLLPLLSPRLPLSPSVQLARRILKLERINASLRQQLESFDKEKRALEEKVTIVHIMYMYMYVCICTCVSVSVCR